MLRTCGHALSRLQLTQQPSPFVPLPLQLVAVVIPDPEYLLPWAKERGLGRDLAELCGNGQARTEREGLLAVLLQLYTAGAGPGPGGAVQQRAGEPAW